MHIHEEATEEDSEIQRPEEAFTKFTFRFRIVATILQNTNIYIHTYTILKNCFSSQGNRKPVNGKNVYLIKPLYLAIQNSRYRLRMRPHHWYTERSVPLNVLTGKTWRFRYLCSFTFDRKKKKKKPSTIIFHVKANIMSTNIRRNPEEKYYTRASYVVSNIYTH